MDSRLHYHHEGSLTLEQELLWAGPARGSWANWEHVWVELAHQFTAGHSVTQA